MIDENPDYITTVPTANSFRELVVIMHYDGEDRGWVIKRCSDALSPRAAKALAESWAAASHLEIR